MNNIVKNSGHKKFKLIIPLLGVNLIYSLTDLFTKLASSHAFLSYNYILYIICAVSTMALYAIIWQQIIKRMPVSEAYMFKGTTVIFTMCIAVFIFNEPLEITNLIGALLIVFGITLFAKS